MQTRSLKERYDEAVESARERLSESAVAEVLSPAMDKDTLLLFLMNFSSWGAGMTQPVEGWIRRSGEATVLLGMEKLGRTIATHAKAEANHHEMMIADLKILVREWNRTHTKQLSAEELLNRPLPTGVLLYQGLHESTIASEMPFCMLAIEYEIESMSLRVGPPWIEQCRRMLGESFGQSLSFVRHHVDRNVSHSAFNDGQLVQVLELRPDSLARMADTGTASLDAFGVFLRDCLDRAKSDRPKLGLSLSMAAC
jgi:hypothetical protein